MKKVNLIIISLSLSLFFFSGCTSKYQTNKLPDEKKINLPTKIKKKRYYLNDEKKEDFRKYVINEFNNGIEKRKEVSKVNQSSLPKNIWVQGYELDKKRY